MCPIRHSKSSLDILKKCFIHLNSLVKGSVSSRFKSFNRSLPLYLAFACNEGPTQYLLGLLHLVRITHAAAARTTSSALYILHTVWFVFKTWIDFFCFWVLLLRTHTSARAVQSTVRVGLCLYSSNKTKFWAITSFQNAKWWFFDVIVHLSSFPFSSLLLEPSILKNLVYNTFNHKPRKKINRLTIKEAKGMLSCPRFVRSLSEVDRVSTS